MTQRIDRAQAEDYCCRFSAYRKGTSLMGRSVKVGLIQLECPPIPDAKGHVMAIKEAMEAKHVPWIEKAGKAGVQILGLQEIFNTPYFCPAQTPEWCDTAEAVPGP